MFGRFQRLGLAPWNLSTNDVSGKPRDIFQHHDMLVHAGELCMYEKKLSQFQFLFSWNRWVKNLGIYNKKKTLVLWNFYRQFYWIIGMLYSIISVNFFGSDCIVEGRAPVSPATWCRSGTCWTAEVGPAFSIFPCVSTSVGNCTSEDYIRRLYLF